MADNKVAKTGKNIIQENKDLKSNIAALKQQISQLTNENEELKRQISNMVKGHHFTKVLKENFKLSKRDEVLKEIESDIPEDIKKINKKVDEIRQRFVNTYGGGIIHGKAKNYLNAKNNETNQSNRKCI